MKVPTQTMTATVTASGSRTRNPAMNVRKRLIIGHHLSWEFHEKQIGTNAIAKPRNQPMNSRLTFCPSGSLGNREPVEIERCAKVRASHCLFRLKRDSGRIGDAVDRVEEADHARGVDKTRRTQRRPPSVACSCQRAVVFADYCLGKCDQQVAVGHPWRPLRGA